MLRESSMQDAEKVLLRHGGSQHEGRPEQAEKKDRDEAESQAHQRQTILERPAADNPPVGDERGNREAADHRGDEEHRAGGGEREIALLEGQRRVLEEKPEERIEHKAHSSRGTVPGARAPA